MDLGGSWPVSDERRHPPGPPPWAEWWHFEMAAEGMGAFARLTVPAEGSARVWAYLVRRDEPVLAVRADDLAAPRSSRLELRGEALWFELECEEPMDHWSVGLEAFGVLLADPADALDDERGIRTGLGFDLGWEAEGPPEPILSGPGYRVPARVHGEVLTGVGAAPEVTRVDGIGSWSHSWGPVSVPGGSAPVSGEPPPSWARVLIPEPPGFVTERSLQDGAWTEVVRRR